MSMYYMLKYFYAVTSVLLLALAGSVMAVDVLNDDFVTSIASNEANLNWGAGRTIDCSGLDASGLYHSADAYTTGWQGSFMSQINPAGTVGKAWIMYEFDEVVKLNVMWVWNFNDVSSTDRGLKNVYVEYSEDGSTWAKLMNGVSDYFVFTKAPGTNGYAHSEELNFNGKNVKCVLITACTSDGNWGGVYGGLSEVRFYVQNLQATTPLPENNQMNLTTNVTLNWTAGDFASSHNIYFGTEFDDVNEAANPNVLPGRGNQTENTYSISGLEYNRIYYWRIDEVTNDGNSPKRGKVWKFLTKDHFVEQPIPSGNITATAFNEASPNWGATRTIDGSGLDVSGLYHNAAYATGWLGDISTQANPAGTMGATWIMYKFNNTVKLGTMWVWNFNYAGSTNRGLKNVYIEYSADGLTWTKLMNGNSDYFVFSQAPGTDGYAHSEELNFNGKEVKYVLLTPRAAEGNWGGVHEALSEVKFFAQGPYAAGPKPVSGSADVLANVALTWSPGSSSASHDVYFGTDFDNVKNATHSSYSFKGNVTDTCYRPCGLVVGQTYYWRIDEINGADPCSPWIGNTWSFTVLFDPALTDIYLLMGQSNMAGYGIVERQDKVASNRIVKFGVAEKWTLAAEPLHGQPYGVGPGFAFAKNMIENDKLSTIVLVPCAVGGTQLSAWVKGAPLYERAVHLAREAMKTGATMKGIIWHQGEGDMHDYDLASTYEVRLSQMIYDIRQDLGVSNLCFVSGEIGRFAIGTYREMVVNALISIANNVDYAGFANSEGLTGDSVHFDALSQRIFGGRYADQMSRFIKSTNLNDELTVNFADFTIFTAQWLNECNDCNSWCKGCDFDKSGFLDFSDLARIFEEWLQ